MGTQRYIDITFDLSYPSDHPKFLQRLGESTPTDIVVQVKNKGVNYSLAGVTLGFEMRNDNDKIMIDKDQSRFTIVSAAQGIFSYRPPEQMQSFFGNSYLAYFTFESGGTRITTERFRFYNDEDVQLAIAPELQEHYVSVIDDLITSNEGAMAEAKRIEDLIKNNQVVKKVGDTMSGNLLMTNPGAAISQRYQSGTGGHSVGWEALMNGQFRMYDWTNGRNVLSYDPVTDYITLNRKHPYLVKSGDTMTGDLTIEGANKGLTVKNGANTMYQAIDGNGDYYMYSSNGKTLVKYITASDTFNVQAANTNLAKKTGDTFTGSMTFDNPLTIRGSASTWDMRPYVSGQYSKGIRHTINTANNFYAIAPIDENGSGQWANQAALYGDTGVWDVKDINVRGGNASNVVTKLKDGQEIVVLTNATSPDVNYKLTAVRRGNTVTVKGAITVDAGATGSAVIVGTLSANYLPAAGNVSIYTPTADLLATTQFFINGTSGVIALTQGAKGKRVDICITYVAAN